MPDPPPSLDEALPRFGLSSFRPGQREVIETVLAGRPTIVVFPTGAGKSLCYQLPAVTLGQLAVVVSPLISLMKDQVDALLGRGIPATFINSTVDGHERDARLRQAVRGELALLYVAPERFRAPGFLSELARARVGLLAIDEAHCIAEWGHDFRPDYARLGEVVRALAPPRLVALTATATPDVREEIRAGLGLTQPAVFVRGFDRPNLTFEVRASGGQADKLGACLKLFAEPPARGGAALVYAATRKQTEKLATALSERGVAAAAYHAGLADEERAAVQERWMAGGVRVVVATNAFGMGVDKRDVRLVIHHDLPGSAEAYYQEAGRAGRDGQPARCVLLFNHGDVRLREFLIASGGDGAARSAERLEAERERLRVIMSYAYARTCRRRFLLEYFGDPEAKGRCAGCDVCGAASELPPLDDEQHLLVRKALATVARLDGRLGRNRVALVLEGSAAAGAAGFEKLSTWGLFRERSHAWVLDLLGGLEAAALIEAGKGEYPTLALTRLGREVMHDRARVPVSFPREAARRRGRGGTPQMVAAALGGLELATYERLRALRTRLAKEERVPAYCVFHDRTLAELARALPTTIEELALVTGFGEMKLKKYGSAVLSALNASE